jgi:hypothetical protein
VRLDVFGRPPVHRREATVRVRAAAIVLRSRYFGMVASFVVGRVARGPHLKRGAVVGFSTSSRGPVTERAPHNPRPKHVTYRHRTRVGAHRTVGPSAARVSAEPICGCRHPRRVSGAGEWGRGVRHCDATRSEADGRTWWVYDRSHPDEAVLAHLSVEASGPGGNTEQTPFGFYHEN